MDASTSLVFNTKWLAKWLAKWLLHAAYLYGACNVRIQYSIGRLRMVLKV